MEHQNCRDMKRFKRIIINHLLELHDISEVASERNRIGKIETAINWFYGKRLRVEAYLLEDEIFEDLFDDYVGMLSGIVRDIHFNLERKFYRKSIQDVLYAGVTNAIWNGTISSTFRTGNDQMIPLAVPSSEFYPSLFQLSQSHLHGIASEIYRNIDNLGKLHPHLETKVVSYDDMKEGLKARAQSREEYRMKAQEEINRKIEESFKNVPPINPYGGMPKDIAHYIKETLGTDPRVHGLFDWVPTKVTTSPHELVPTEEGVVQIMIENNPFMQEVIIHPTKEESQ